MFRPAFFVTAMAVAGSAAAADLVDGRDPARVAEVLQSFGYRAQLASDKAGDPMIATRFDGLESRVYFFGCTDGEACRSILFHICFDLPEGSDLALMNAWNGDRLVGRAYLDAEADPCLDHFIALAGGVDVANLGESFLTWVAAVEEFRARIGF